jgi:hypothetical protein
MRPGSFRLRGFAIAAPLACLSLALLSLCGATAQTRSQSESQSQSGSTSSSASQADSDAAAKASERKKRYEEARKALESKDQPAPQPKTQNAPANPNSTAKPVPKPASKIVFTIPVTMGVGETERFYLFDEQRGNVTTEAQWTAEDETSAVDFSVAGGVPTVVGKGSGFVFISGALGDRSALVALSIIPKDKMTAGTVRWTQAATQVRSSLHIVPAVPNFVPHK